VEDRRIRAVSLVCCGVPGELSGGVDGEERAGPRHGENTCDNDRHDSLYDPFALALWFSACTRLDLSNDSVLKDSPGEGSERGCSDRCSRDCLAGTEKNWIRRYEYEFMRDATSLLGLSICCA
jgi:hypothetical protein